MFVIESPQKAEESPLIKMRLERINSLNVDGKLQENLLKGFEPGSLTLESIGKS